jgi:hypothetical protein
MQSNLARLKMAHATAHPHFDYSPEEAVHEIKAQRKRNALLVLGGAILAFIGLGSLVYLSYDDVPAPDSPANAAVPR